MRTWVVAASTALLVAGCSHRTAPPATPQITVFFCRAGSDTLVPLPYSVDPNLPTAQLESALVGQLLAGPGGAEGAVVLFPPGTQARITLNGTTASVNFSGTLAKPFRGGASDEVALFKALTYTVTSVGGVTAVQVLVDGRIVPTLPGGEFELDEPLTRETFSQ